MKLLLKKKYINWKKCKGIITPEFPKFLSSSTASAHQKCNTSIWTWLIFRHLWSGSKEQNQFCLSSHFKVGHPRAADVSIGVDVRYIPMDKPTSPLELALPPCAFTKMTSFAHVWPEQVSFPAMLLTSSQSLQPSMWRLKALSYPRPSPGPCTEQPCPPAGNSSSALNHQGTNFRKYDPVFCTSFLCLYLAISKNPSNKR